MDFGPPAGASWFGEGESVSSGSRPTTSNTFVSAQSSLDGTTPRGHQPHAQLAQHPAHPHAADFPTVASLIPGLLDALELDGDVEALAGAIMHLAVLLDSASGEEAALMAEAIRTPRASSSRSALSRLVELLNHPDQRVIQATLLVVGNLSTHDFDANGPLARAACTQTR